MDDVVVYKDLGDGRGVRECYCKRSGEVVYGKYQGDRDGELLGKISLVEMLKMRG